MFIKRHDTGKNVKLIQAVLNQNGFYRARVDGIFGFHTEEAVKRFQRAHGLNADGVVGPFTSRALRIEFVLNEFKITRPPESYDEIYEFFGDPLLSSYWPVYGEFLETPESLNHCFPSTFKNQNGFWCNKLVKPFFRRVYNDIDKFRLSQYLKTFDGCYNLRKIRGGQSLSLHSWAIAVDHNAFENPLGSHGEMTPDVIQIFKKHGFSWGGDFRRKDPMHFEFFLR